MRCGAMRRGVNAARLLLVRRNVGFAGADELTLRVLRRGARAGPERSVRPADLLKCRCCDGAAGAVAGAGTVTVLLALLMALLMVLLLELLMVLLLVLMLCWCCRCCCWC